MSLTTVLRAHSKDLRPSEAFFRSRAGITEDEVAIQVPRPEVYKGLNAALVGTAFDFWLRGYLCVRYGATEEGNVISLLLDIPGESCERMGLPNFDVEMIQDGVTLRDFMRSCMQNRIKMIESGDITSFTFYDNCFELAQLEGLYRSGRITPPCPEEGYTDLHQMAMLAINRDRETNMFSAATYDLNPTFPLYGERIGGADADYAQDRTLVEVKTGDRLFPDLAFSQAVSYITLDYIEQQHNGMLPRYDSIGLYAARFGVFVSIPMDTIAKHAREVAQVVVNHLNSSCHLQACSNEMAAVV